MTIDLAAPRDTLEAPPVEPGRSERWALRMLQLGAIAVVLAVTTYKAFELDRFFVPKEFALHVTALVGGLCALQAFRRTTLSAVDALLLAWLLLGLVSSVIATNVWVATRAFTVTTSGVAIFWIARTLKDARLEKPLLNALAVAVTLGALTACLQAYGVRTDLFSLNRSPGGTLGNRNFVAHMAAFGLPVVLYAALTATRTSVYLLGLAGTSIITIAQVLTRSRAGWLACAAALVAWVTAVVVSPPVRRDPTTRARMIGVLVALALGVGAAMLVPNTLRWRSENPYLESMRGVANFQEGSGHGRLIQYRRTLRIAGEDPVLGAGPGNWAVEYPKYAARNDPSLNNNEPGTTSNPWPSSDWVAFIAEHGLIATMMLLLVFTGIALRATQRLLTAWTPDDALAGAAALATVFGTLVAGMFDAVLLLALPTLLVWATLGALWSPAQRRLNLTPRVQGGLLMALVLCAGIGVLRSAGQLGAIGIYATQDGTGWLSFASGLDPGNYRIHTRLARFAGSRARRCRHADAAHALYPSAEEARALDRRCSRRR